MTKSYIIIEPGQHDLVGKEAWMTQHQVGYNNMTKSCIKIPEPDNTTTIKCIKKQEI